MLRTIENVIVMPVPQVEKMLNNIAKVMNAVKESAKASKNYPAAFTRVQTYVCEADRPVNEIVPPLSEMRVTVSSTLERFGLTRRSVVQLGERAVSKSSQSPVVVEHFSIAN